MAREDWFRSPLWDANARDDFEKRLARSRPYNRPQHLKNKALALRDNGSHDAAVELLLRAIALDPEGFHAPLCHELLGNLALERGDTEAAEVHFRECIRLRPEGDATTGEAPIGLAEALHRKGRFQEALAALVSHPDNKMVWQHTICRWHATRAEIAYSLGDLETARVAGLHALAQFEAPDTFAGHPGSGAAKLEPGRRRALERIANGKSPRGLWGLRR